MCVCVCIYINEERESERHKEIVKHFYCYILQIMNFQLLLQC